jgi:hypothetical protein
LVSKIEAMWGSLMLRLGYPLVSNEFSHTHPVADEVE